MPDKNRELACSITGIIRESVTNTIATLFNIAVDANDMVHKVPSLDDFVCCGELIQDDARAKLMFLFDHDLIEQLVHRAFPGTADIDPALYESAALEIVNIVSNNLKMYLNVHGYKLHLAIPYIPQRDRIVSDEAPFVQLAFSSKSSAVMGVDFYLRSA